MEKEQLEQVIKTWDWLDNVCTIAVVLALAGEWYTSRRLSRYKDELVEKQNIEIAAANQRAGEANERAAILEDRAKPRRLTERDRQILKNALSKYSGQTFRVYVTFDNAEGLDLGRDIQSALKDDCCWSPGFGVITPHGLEVTAGVTAKLGKEDEWAIYGPASAAGSLNGRDRETKTRFEDTNKALMDAGLEASQYVIVPDTMTIPKGTIGIFVGRKPDRRVPLAATKPTVTITMTTNDQ